MTILIIECIPKSDDKHEGRMLYEFLHMEDPDIVSLLRFSNKSDLIGFLEKDEYLQAYDYIHLSGHGKGARTDSPYFRLPRGHMSSSDFPEGCFEGKRVAFSACELGRNAFVRPFKDQTGAESVIAPQREILFTDAAVWFTNYYYFVLKPTTLGITAFERTQAGLKPYVRGVFRFM